MTELVQLRRTNNLSSQVDTLFAMWDDTRRMLLREIKGLRIEELDFTPDDRTIESIATLLMHIAGVEWAWIFMDIGGKDLDKERWKFGFPLRESVNIDQISGKPLEYYLDVLNDVRADALNYFKTIDDDDLEKVIDVDGEPHTVEWIIYHVFEHELTHIGQIRLLKRLYRVSSQT